jgi:replication factor C small subunit
MLSKFLEVEDITELEREQTKRNSHSLWCERYRPVTMENYIGNKNLKDKIVSYIDQMDIPHLLLHGKAGTGKTTLAKIIIKNIDCDSMYINASDENNVDTVRDKIKTFSSSLGFKDMKIVILDEADYMTANAQAALRNIMETYSRSTRFILTCNYVEKIVPPIISRCQSYEVTPPSKSDAAKRIAHILVSEGVSFEVQDIKLLVDANYPDIRKLINTAQRQSLNNQLIINSKEMIDSDMKLKILDILKTKTKKECFSEIRQLIADNSINSFEDIYKILFDNVDDYAKGRIAPTIVLLAEMKYKSAFVVDKEITFMSTIIQLLDIIKE